MKRNYFRFFLIFFFGAAVFYLTAYEEMSWIKSIAILTTPCLLAFLDGAWYGKHKIK